MSHTSSDYQLCLPKTQATSAWFISGNINIIYFNIIEDNDDFAHGGRKGFFVQDKWDLERSCSEINVLLHCEQP